jgi:hypothetical protein
VLELFGSARHPPAPYHDYNYEKNCLILNHGVSRHRVCRFLRGKTGNNRNVNNGDNGSLADVYTAQEARSQEEDGEDQGVTVGRRIAGVHRVTIADPVTYGVRLLAAARRASHRF